MNRDADRTGRHLPSLLAAGLVLAAAGCAVSPEPPAPEPDAPEISAASAEMRAHYARVETNLKGQGLLRTDGGTRDAPFGTRQLVDNFVRIALYDEYVTTRSGLFARETKSRLRRWQEPVRFSVEIGPAVPAAQARRDRAAIAGYVDRLSRIARHPMRVTNGTGNFHVLVLTEDERREIGPRLAELVPGIGGGAVRTIQSMPRSTFCLVYAFSEGDSPTYAKAIAVIRAEHPDALRLSCIHEEIAQGLGLANDSPVARPSIFNDDEEFGLLTRHDELLLRILYDDRLTPGMTEDEARPIVEEIAAELLGDGPS